MGDLDAQFRKFRRELSSGTVSLALLAILAAADEPMYGYQIAKRFERDGDGVLIGKQSALYPVLRTLEATACSTVMSNPPTPGRRDVITGSMPMAARHCAIGPPPGLPPATLSIPRLRM